MGLFNQRRPRGFRHEYMFVDKRKERLKAMEEQARRELGMDDGQAHEGRLSRGVFLNATKYAARRGDGRRRGAFFITSGVAVILIILLVVIWKLLLCL